MQTVKKVSDSTVDLSAFVTTREGYRFDGWYAHRELTKAVTSIKITNHTKVYAKWTLLDTKLPFSDVAEGNWFYEDVRYVYAKGLMIGISATSFEPNAMVTREQLAVILHRHAQYKGQDVSVGEDTNILSYTDAESISEFAVPAMQ